MSTTSILTEGVLEIKHLQEDVKDLSNLMKHQTALLTENFTDIRKELRSSTRDIRSDVDLLFVEVETLKRKTHKIENSLSK